MRMARNCIPNSPTCKPGCDCDRFLEFWNLVFNQFNQDKNGVLHPLPQTGIDTGSGLERVAMLLQEVDSVYDTDQLKCIIEKISLLTKKEYKDNLKPAFRVITDHIRAISFAIGDGILPDKTGRGYVIRRLIRRAALYVRKLDVFEPFLYKLVPTLVEIYGEEYPELTQRQSLIQNTILSEEKLFLNTLEIGLEHIENLIRTYSKKGEKVFSGKDLFKLYGTYGFPFELTKELLADKGFECDEKGFEEELEKDRNQSRETWKGKKLAVFLDTTIIPSTPTEFLGYTRITSNSEVVGVLDLEKPKEVLKTGENGILILKETPFYAESGGQIGDTGYIKSSRGIFQVLDTQKESDIYLHIGVVLSGEFQKGDEVIAEVDEERRKLLTYHHSGTHLLHAALRRVLGTHVTQKASLVSNEYLRFDFSHPNPLKPEEIQKIEEDVNSVISSEVEVTTNVYDLETAKKTGALSFFEEKYGDKVRVVQMGEFSSEFCGGCHVSNTKDIGYFLIRKESSPGAGNRRIEALCGPKVIEYFQEEFQELSYQINEVNSKLKEFFNNSSHFITETLPAPEQIQKAFEEKKSRAVFEFRKLKQYFETLLEEKKAFLHDSKKQQEAKLSQNLLSTQEELLRKVEPVGKFSFLSHNVENVKMELVKELGDSLKNKVANLFFVVHVKNKDDAILFMAGKEAVTNGLNCNELMKKTLSIVEGRGGGKVDMAQGSVKRAENFPQLLEALRREINF
ncbi:MAG: alanine--tRNA ligase [Leptospiraceae bacterium]|nr:alanine--tRNA ligase [Leptospiraceae bacterium]